ncbi:alpha/beta fold hydrolase [Rhodanobacter umsongensis]|uniref:Alpha/beta fold hydrolase n=1 Tax=Rhodanobacter umsongensis TaxID=633153 RepID=A0ABW0JIV4_9GAMM
MSHFDTSDRTRLFYRDWGSGRPIVFVASWALDSRAWGSHMQYFNALGCRCIAMDRRGHGRSDDPGRGYHYDRLADDLAELLDHLDLREVTLVAHSMATGECTRYLTRHGSDRIARVVYLAPVAASYLDGSRDACSMDSVTAEPVLADMRRDLPKWLADSADGFFLPAETGTSPDTIRHTIDMVLDASLHALIECFRAKYVDQRDELRAIDVPLLVVHGDRDVSEPVQQGRAIAALVPHSRYLEYAGAPHGLYHTHFERLVADMFAFMRDTPTAVHAGTSHRQAAA